MWALLVPSMYLVGSPVLSYKRVALFVIPSFFVKSFFFRELYSTDEPRKPH